MPPPGYDPSAGGGMPMTPPGYGPGPQMNDQAFDIPVMQPQDEMLPPDQQTTTKTDGSDDGTADDSANVASTSAWESISKLFSGMNGLACGCDQPPPWFNTGLGGNAPFVPHPLYSTAQPAPPISGSTTTGVVGAAVVLMVGAAAIFLWTKGKKK